MEYTNDIGFIVKFKKRGDFLNSDHNIDIQIFGQVLNMTFRMISNRINSKFKASGYSVTPEQYVILTYLYRHDELQQNQLSKLTAKDEPSISRIINNMIKNGIVKRQQHPNDKRTNLICLTEKAKMMREDLYKESLLVLQEALKGISDDNIKTLYYMLNQIIGNLK